MKLQIGNYFQQRQFAALIIDFLMSTAVNSLIDIHIPLSLEEMFKFFKTQGT